MGGDIWCESVFGEGSTFSFTVVLGAVDVDLNLETKQESQRIQEKKEQDIMRPYEKCCILLVEDNMVNQVIAKRILEIAGLNVDIAENGVEALEALKNKSYDLVLMDIQMPEMDGLTATRFIREQTDLNWMPIVALSAHAMSEDHQKSLEAGMNAHMTKPIDSLELFTCLAEWLEKGLKARKMNISLKELL